MMKRRTRALIGVGAVIAVGGTAVAAMAANGGGNVSHKTVAVVRGDIVEKALAVGTIEPDVEISVKSKVSGVVRRRFAETGDFVRAGEPLLEVRPDPTPLELVEARRQVEMRDIERTNLQREFARQRTLKERGLVSEQAYESAERQSSEAELQLTLSRERLALLEEGRVTIANVHFETVIRSPIDGFVLEEMVEIGDPVVPLTQYQEGTVLMTMAGMRDLIFRGTVDEIDVGKLVEGMPVTAKIGALPGASIEGVLSKISLKARKEENATVFPVEITLGQAHGVVLRAGYSANADVIIDRRDNVLVIPERLVSWDADGAARVTVLSLGATEERVIEVGLSDAISIEVVSGLAEGDLVVEKPPRDIE